MFGSKSDADVEQPVAEVTDDEKEQFDKDKIDLGKETESKGLSIMGMSPRTFLIKAIQLSLVVLLTVYLLAAFIIDFERAKFLFIALCLAVAFGVLYFLNKKNPAILDKAQTETLSVLKRAETEPKVGLIFLAVILGIMILILALTVESSRNLVSLLGLVTCLAFTWAFSYNPGKVALRPVIGSVFIQFIFGYVVIRTDWGLSTIQFLSDQLTFLLGKTYDGSGFVFNWLTNGSFFAPDNFFVQASGATTSLGPPFFFNVLPQVIFFSAFISVMYYLRVLPFLVKSVGYFLSIILGTSASESLSAAGNIFIGQTEAPLLVRPFMADMTESELHAVMTGGFATIAGSVFGIYVSFGIDPVALLASSVMSAPAALALSKLACPELEDSKTGIDKKNSYDIPKSDDVNVMHALSTGAVTGTVLMMNIAGNLIAILAVIGLLDNWLGYLGDKVDIFLSFNAICEVIFYPVAWLMGVDPADCRIVASLIGYKVFANEFVAYEKLAFVYRGAISERSYYIASYALSGFSNFGSIGIQLGGLTPLAPNQGPKLAKLVTSAMIVGNTACIMTACIAGLFYKV